MTTTYAELKRFQQYIEQAGKHCTGLLREIAKAREIEPEPCEGYTQALDHLEGGARILFDLTAALHFAMRRRTTIDEYADHLERAKSHIMRLPEERGAGSLFPPSASHLVD